MNKNLFYGAYTRTNSYFSNSELASSGLPHGRRTGAAGAVPRQAAARAVHPAEFKLPVTDGSGNNREGLRAALDTAEAGRLGGEGPQAGRRRRASRCRFEILLERPDASSASRCPTCRWLQRLGIDARVRTVDPAQYQRLTDDFDFDMTIVIFAESDMPGQRAARLLDLRPARRRRAATTSMGVCDPVVDALVEQGDRRRRTATQLVTATHALDRVLLWSWYVVPQLASADLPRRLLGPLRPAGQAGARRLRVRHLVDRPEARRRDRRRARRRGALIGHARPPRWPPICSAGCCWSSRPCSASSPSTSSSCSSRPAARSSR